MRRAPEKCSKPPAKNWRRVARAVQMRRRFGSHTWFESSRIQRVDLSPVSGDPEPALRVHTVLQWEGFEQNHKFEC